jgi:hypothetical protein
MAFRLISPPSDLILRIQAKPYQSQKMLLSLNGHLLQTLNLDPAAFMTYAIPLPAGLLTEDNRLDFGFPDAHSPLSVGESQDCRSLGAWVAWMEFRAIDLLSPPERIRFEDASSDGYLLDGWDVATPTGRWTTAERASMAFRLASPRADLVLRFEARPFQSQKILISLNGRLIETLRPNPKGFAVYDIALPAGLLAEDNRLDFEFPDAHSPLSVGESQDSRRLGAWVKWMEFRSRK